jgi:hypothetical protein
MRKAIVTCDQCGVTEPAPMGDAAFGLLPPTWVTVSSRGDEIISAGIRQQDFAKDLCSWACAAAYTAKRAAA